MKLLRLIKDMFVESLNQIWTLLGMFVAWCVLTGSARMLVGDAILLTLAVWLLTLRVREPIEKSQETEEE